MVVKSEIDSITDGMDYILTWNFTLVFSASMPFPNYFVVLTVVE